MRLITPYEQIGQKRRSRNLPTRPRSTLNHLVYNTYAINSRICEKISPWRQIKFFGSKCNFKWMEISICISARHKQVIHQPADHKHPGVYSRGMEIQEIFIHLKLWVAVARHSFKSLIFFCIFVASIHTLLYTKDHWDVFDKIRMSLLAFSASIIMLWVYGHYKVFNSFSARTVCRRQNLMS